MPSVRTLLTLVVCAAAASGLHASDPRDTELLEAARNGHVSAVRALLDAGANPAAKTDAGSTPLHLAARGGHLATAEALLDGGAQINAADTSGRTPLDEAEANGHSGLSRFLTDRGARQGAGGASGTGDPDRQLNPSLKLKTREAFEQAIGEPAVMLDSPNLCFFAPRRRAREAEIVFGYLVKAYDELHAIVGVHTEYKVAVYAFPKGDARGWGGTSNCSIEYDESNLDLAAQAEWTQYGVPHVSGYMEELAHSFVHATRAQFGWEMIGWSIGADVSQRIAGNPIVAEQIRRAREVQRQTYERYVANGCVLPDDIPANLCDRIHAWILRQCADEYGPRFWENFFTEIRAERRALHDAAAFGDADKIRNRRYRITVDCFNRLPGIRFKERLAASGISLRTDVKSLHPEQPGWNRRLAE